MGKTDRATAIKKESSKARQRNAASEKAPRKEEAEVEAEAAEEEDDDSTAAAPQRAPVAEGPPSGKAKKLEAAAKKKQQASRQMDAFEAMELERRREARQRVVERLLRLLFVGFILDALKGKEGEGTNGSSAKEAKGKKKGPSSGRGQSYGDSDGFNVKSLKEKANTYAGPAIMLFFMIALLAIRAAEEGYHPADVDEHQFNYYEVMGLTKGVDQMEIRKSYKALALKYHPDKNPDCAECVEKFGKISKAYDTLSNPEARKAYDSGRRAKKSLESQSSVELTADDFESKVLRSNEVWYVQAYDPNDGNCKSFSTGWEDVAHSYESNAKFGRLDVSKKELKELLPFRPVLLPVVFRYARGQQVEHWMFSERRDDEERSAGGGKALTRFMESTFPEFQRHDTAGELKQWWAGTEQPRVLVVGPSSSSRAAKAVDFMPVQRLAHVWKEMFSFASAEASVVAEALGSDFALGRGQTWALVVRGASPASKTEVRNVRDMAPLIQDFMAEEIPRQAPVATVRNYQQLCGETSLSQGVKNTYCLLLVDTGADAVAKALKELESSRSAYYQEVQELRNSGEDSEEPFRIQPVRVMTAGSRFPWNPAAPGPSFSAVWAEASKARAFVLELETRKFAAVKTPSMNELFQNIAYEDLKLQELNEDGPPLDRLFSDPETTLRRELSSLLSSSIGAIIAYLLVACIVSVAPELELQAIAGALAALVAVLAVVWPALSRKFMGFFWCALNSSRTECQSNV